MSWYIDLSSGDVWGSWQDPSVDPPYANLVTDYDWDNGWDGSNGVPLEEMRTGPMADAATEAETNGNTNRRIKIAEDAVYGRIKTV